MLGVGLCVGWLFTMARDRQIAVGLLYQDFVCWETPKCYSCKYLWSENEMLRSGCHPILGVVIQNTSTKYQKPITIWQTD
ncbi:hypothetical protein EJ08DRAFT_518920 [Tothia fuscella]|uniref:Uncharacterized protein n=1 Tax=Tothia fuscella TaxID=1048955 RepID=A0A9P4NHK9_9PEZI|nr:hypothetical protein EJ08DRAFT_518920 [Tothia fuscella]